jgi:hypothetical protein
MKPLLIIFNPRRIPAAMKSLEALTVDKLWIRNYPYTEIVKFLPDLLAQCDHDAIGTMADDTIVPQKSLDMVLDSYKPGAVYTGYCNIFEGEESDDDFVNLTKTPLIEKEVATWDCYDWATKKEVESTKGLFRSYFAGDSMTFSSRELWERYPFQTQGNSNAQGDYALCTRLQRDNVPIWAVPGASFKHLKKGQNTEHHEGGRVEVEPGMGSVEWDLR